MCGDNLERSLLVHIATLYTVSTTVGPSIAGVSERIPRAARLSMATNKHDTLVGM